MTRRTPILWLIGVLGFCGVMLTAANAVNGTGMRHSLLQPTPPPAIDTPCQPQGQLVQQPSSNQYRFCPEYLVDELPDSPIANITSVAYAPDCTSLDTLWCGHVFFTRPSTGEIAWVGDFDPATETYPIHSFASGLSTPNGLVWHEGVWYVSGGQSIYALSDSDGDGSADEIITLVDDLPTGSQGWTGSILVGQDSRLYVTTGTRCDDCPPNNPAEGAILSFALDGSDRQVVATGLHDAFDLAWHHATQTLYTADSERDTLGPNQPLDELNTIEPGADYGWPYCYETPQGTVAHPNLTLPTSDYCQDTVSPTTTFPAHSAPSGLAFYNGSAFPEFADDLLVVLRGERVAQRTQGYAVLRLCLAPNGQPETCHDAYGNAILNENGEPATRQILLPVDLFYGYSLEVMNIQQQGFYPEHPVDIAVGPEGKIAISLMEGRIIQITPVTSRLE